MHTTKYGSYHSGNENDIMIRRDGLREQFFQETRGTNKYVRKTVHYIYMIVKNLIYNIKIIFTCPEMMNTNMLKYSISEINRVKILV